MSLIDAMINGEYRARLNGQSTTAPPLVKDMTERWGWGMSAVRIDIQSVHDGIIGKPEDMTLMRTLPPFPEMCCEWVHTANRATPEEVRIKCAAIVRDMPDARRIAGVIFVDFRDWVEYLPWQMDYNASRELTHNSLMCLGNQPDNYEPWLKVAFGGFSTVLCRFLHEAQWRTLTTYRRDGGRFYFNNSPLERVRRAGYLTRAHFMEFRPKPLGGGAAFGCELCNSGKGHENSAVFGGLSHLGVFEVPASGVKLDQILGPKLRAILQDAGPRKSDVDACRVLRFVKERRIN